MRELQARWPLCASSELQEGGLAVPFEVVYVGQTCRAFAIRYQGLAQAYLNRCTHVAMELDWQPNRIFDDSGQWLLCASHGAAYRPDTGQCVGGPCRGGLVKISVSERDSVIFWHSAGNLQPLAPPIPL
jgi:nitrite reductase/ring-hydroxylating ferredoxin subunit